MKLSVSCPECGKAGTVPTEAIGRQAKCPACGTRFTIAEAIGESLSTDVEPNCPPAPSSTPAPSPIAWSLDRGPFSVEPWRNLDDSNVLSHSTYCRARGRYEIALEFMRLHVESFGRSVERMSAPADSAEERRYARQSLADMKANLKAFSKECPRLIETRWRILEAIAASADDAERKSVEKAAPHKGTTKYGIICNQLERGGWLRLEKRGRTTILCPVAIAPGSNADFLRLEVDRPVHGPNAP